MQQAPVTDNQIRLVCEKPKKNRIHRSQFEERANESHSDESQRLKSKSNRNWTKKIAR